MKAFDPAARLEGGIRKFAKRWSELLEKVSDGLARAAGSDSAEAERVNAQHVWRAGGQPRPLRRTRAAIGATRRPQCA